MGASSDPAKFSKSLKSIENYIQKTYKMPDDIVKAIQQMKRPTLDYPSKPAKDECVDDQGTFDEDIFDMAKFTWKEDYKAMRVRKRERIECMGAYLWSMRTRAEKQARRDGGLQQMQEYK